MPSKLESKLESVTIHVFGFFFYVFVPLFFVFVFGFLIYVYIRDTSSPKVLPSPSPAISQRVSSSTSSRSSYGHDRESTWGELFDHYGVVYDTLTSSQQALVNYPRLDHGCVYYVKNGKSYHAVNWCYTLANSKNIQSSSLPFARSYQLEPCSKCVDPKQVQ